MSEASVDVRWLNLGSETQSQNRINREYTDSIVFETNILGSRPADTATRIFGVEISSPITPAPIIGSRVMDKVVSSGVWSKRTSYGHQINYMEELAAGARRANSLMWLGVDKRTETLGHMIEDGSKVVLMVKPLKEKAEIIKILKWAEESRCVAVGMDIDAMFYEKAFDELEGPLENGEQSIEDLKRYKQSVKLPFILKGILSRRDARIAKDEIGADALVVSNHGGEALDYSIPVLRALPEVRKEVGGDIPLIVDSGFRRGTDALKALALGANLVCVGTLMVVALAAHGREGVQQMLEILGGELKRAMTLTGCMSVSEISDQIIRFRS